MTREQSKFLIDLEIVKSKALSDWVADRFEAGVTLEQIKDELRRAMTAVDTERYPRVAALEGAGPAPTIAFAEGYRACSIGKKGADCPYPRLPQKLDWLKGFAKRAQEEADSAQEALENTRG
jgi:ribosome modulation factor